VVRDRNLHGNGDNGNTAGLPAVTEVKYACGSGDDHYGGYSEIPLSCILTSVAAAMPVIIGIYWVGVGC